MKIGCFSATFSTEDIDNIMSDLEPNILPAQLFDHWNDQVAACRKNLKIVVGITPTSKNYRQHVRNYSGFFDRAAVMYMQPLSESAIEEISKQNLKLDDNQVQQSICSIVSLINSELK